MMCKYRVTHNILLKLTISRITKKVPSLLYIVQTMQLSWERNLDLQRHTSPPSSFKFFFNCSSLMSHLSFWSHQQFNLKWSSASLNSSLLNISIPYIALWFCHVLFYCKCLSFCYEWFLSMVINAHFIADDGSSLSVHIGLKKFQ